MRKKKLLIYLSQKDIKFKDDFNYYINLGDRHLKINNAQQIFIKEYYRNNYDYFRKKIVVSLSKKILNKKFKNFQLDDFEIFNLRNDKINNIDLIINILILKKIVKRLKIDQICLFTDNILLHHVIIKIYPKVEIVHPAHKSKKLLPFLKITKFYLKTFIIFLMMKLSKKNRSLKKIYKIACISLTPIFYKNKKEIFFQNRKNLKINFLLTDETHLNLTILDIYRILKNRYDNLVHVESFIGFNDLLLGLIKSYKDLYLLNKFNMKFYVDKTDLSFFFTEYLVTSFINRSKLNIYTRAIPTLFKNFQIKKFKMYLFEYNFGFFLTNLIRKKFKNIEIIGYQHGIFSDKLMWFDVLKNSKKISKYLPNKIVSFNSQSLKDYKKILSSRYVDYELTEKKLSNVSILFRAEKRNTKKRNILILPGTHDARIVYERFKNKITSINKSNDFFYIKFHPKNKILLPNLKNLKIINSIKKKSFNTALISSTSTLTYDFMRLKKNFMIYDIDNKQNLISSDLIKKVRLYRI